MRYHLLALTGAFILAGCSNETSVPEVSFSKDVVPILQKHCLECHEQDGKGYKKAGLLMTSHADLMKGTKFGPVVVPGDADSSVLNQVIEGRVDKSIRMPHGGAKLPEAEIATLRNWVEQGAQNN